MKSDRNIVFLGMMGSGKTSIGFLVSKKLKLDFYDVDHYIENKLKMKISNIFKNKGEKFFREYEEKITLELMKIKGIVVSLGGGAFLNKALTYVGGYLVLTGVSEMLFPMPQPPKFESEEDPRLSFSFGGAQQTGRAGTPVPLVYGEIFTGSVVISGGIDTEQVQA